MSNQETESRALPAVAVNAKAIGQSLSVSGATVRRWHREGLIPGIRVTDRCLRFDPDEVAAAIRGKRQ
jgi:predicted site-specific integrase-resolvase